MLERTRQENKAKGLAFLQAGNRPQALECFQKCVDITPEMALEVIKVCSFAGCEMEDMRNKTEMLCMTFKYPVTSSVYMQSLVQIFNDNNFPPLL